MGSQQDGASERRRLDREHQAAVLGPMDFSRGQFEHARFIAAQVGFKQAKGGDIEINLMVPFAYREQALAMLDASAVPLSVDVVPWRHGQTHEVNDGG